MQELIEAKLLAVVTCWSSDLRDMKAALEVVELLCRLDTTHGHVNFALLKAFKELADLLVRELGLQVTLTV